MKKRCPECLSGIFTVHFIGGEPTKVYCDLETDNGKYLIIIFLTGQTGINSFSDLIFLIPVHLNAMITINLFTVSMSMLFQKLLHQYLVKNLI